MAATDSGLDGLIAAVIARDEPAVRELLAASPELAQARVTTGATRAEASPHFHDGIGHYIYAGDTALDVGAANRRGAQPLHYAVDGGLNGPRWDPVSQSDTIGRLLDAGADPNATDKGGTTPLHRAIRNRSAAAVEVLLERGADALRPNGRGSTAWQLANWTTGKGGSGSAAAKAQQAEIQRLLEAHDAVTG
jgi:ankyrin repeat protein